MDNQLKITSGYDGLNLPYSPEAEQSVLGAVLLDSSCLDRVMDILPTPDYFHLSKHQTIYTVMLEKITNGEKIDFVTILDRLRAEKDFDELNDKTYLLQLANLVPSIANVEIYAGIVREKYEIRTLITTARDIVESAADGNGDPAELLDSAEEKIMGIRSEKRTSGLQHIRDVLVKAYDTIEQLSQPGAENFRVPTGISELDEMISGLNKTDLILLAARPGMGKTSFALNIVRYAALNAGKKVAFFSLEMSREQLATRLLSSEALVSSEKLRSGKLQDSDWRKIAAATDVLSKAEIYFDDAPNITVPEMKARLRRLGGVDLVVIDYLQLMSTGKRTENRVQEISEITRNLKILAKEFDVPVLTLSQLSRSTESRTSHKPMLSDLRDSGSIEQDADIVMFLYREDYYQDGEKDAETKDNNQSECIVAKNRHGRTDSVKLHWQGEFTRFTGQEVIHREG
ncbi:MAG: replicative DNA helicase [Firmicutes bacterium]|nr:replicative DNA helicase [Bacillota bacterium]